MRSRPRHPIRTLSARLNEASGYLVCRLTALDPRATAILSRMEKISLIPPDLAHDIFRRREMPSVSVPYRLRLGHNAARFRYRKRDRSPSSLAAAPVGSLMRRAIRVAQIRPRARYFGDELQSARL